MKKAPTVAGFILAAQTVFAQTTPVAPPTPVTAASALSKFISLPDGPKGQWVIAPGKGESIISCKKGEKTPDGKLGNPLLSVKAGRISFEGASLEFSTTPTALHIRKQNSSLPEKIGLSLDSSNYCERNGDIKGDGAQLVDDIVSQIARQLNLSRRNLASILAAFPH